MPDIPGRVKVLASSWVFIVASIFLLAEFILIHHADPSIPAVASLIDWFGLLEGIGWILGFSLLIDWIVFSTFPVWGFSRRALLGATLKLIASAFFTVQPWGHLTSPGYGMPTLGPSWSNFVGICFFHLGNCIDAVGMFALFDSSQPFAHGNWPVLGMWVYCAATWFLITADAIFWLSLPVPYGPALVAPSDFVGPGQVIGATLLLVGSVIYTAWAQIPGIAQSGKEPLMPPP